MDGPIHSAAAQQRRVGRVDDGVNVEFRDVAGNRNELDPQIPGSGTRGQGLPPSRWRKVQDGVRAEEIVRHRFCGSANLMSHGKWVGGIGAGPGGHAAGRRSGAGDRAFGGPGAARGAMGLQALLAGGTSFDHGLACSATAVLIGHVAGATKTIRVGSGGIMLPNHAPLVVAEQFGTLEAIYPGPN